jgi:hypothetical protein
MGLRDNMQLVFTWMQVVLSRSLLLSDFRCLWQQRLADALFCYLEYVANTFLSMLQLVTVVFTSIYLFVVHSTTISAGLD